ncbi:F1F0 ATP synthase subunit e, mitochondrial [Elasticomyces elasticus]|nr:F1F0 ATP synthase subunit e, mitochondrial [Elasticomyces elasticus]
MASSGVNVLRWSALVFGVFYGFSHQNAIYNKDKIVASQHEWDRKQSLIDQAKQEWRKKNDPSSGKNGVISDPENPKFDLEAYLNDVHARNSA